MKEKETALSEERRKAEAAVMDVEDLKGLLNDSQKRRDDLKGMNEELTKQVTTALEARQSLEVEMNKRVEELELQKTAMGKQHAKEVTEWAEKCSRFELRLTEKDDDIETLQHKLTDARSYKGQIFDDVQMLEDNLKQMQETIQTLRKQLADKTKELEVVAYELNCTRQQHNSVGELVEMKRKNTELASTLSERERQLDHDLTTLSAALQKAKQDVHDSTVKLTSVEKEKMSLLDSNEQLRSQVAALIVDLKLCDEKARRAREETKQEMLSRILTLKQEKLEAEARLEELQEQMDLQKRSFFEAPSLMDELKMIDDMGGYKPSRLSLAPVAANLERQLEQLKVELVREM